MYLYAIAPLPLLSLSATSLLPNPGPPSASPKYRHYLLRNPPQCQIGPAGPEETPGRAKGPIRSCETGSKSLAEAPDRMGFRIVWQNRQSTLALMDGGLSGCLGKPARPPRPRISRSARWLLMAQCVQQTKFQKSFHGRYL